MTIETDTFLAWLEAQTPGYDADTVLDVIKYLAELDVIPSYEHTLQALHDRHADFDEQAEADHLDRNEYLYVQRQMRAEIRQWERAQAERMNEKLSR